MLTTLGDTCPVRPATADDHVDGMPADLVARPRSTAEVSHLLAACHRNRLAVVPRGAATKLRWGMPPTRVDVIVDTTALNRVVEHVEGDLVATVEAGCPVTDLNARLARTRQRLALDPMLPGATIGGTLAANVSGPLRLSAGAARDLLIGVRIVRADGTIAHAGGKVVKNVAGYDLGKLFTGSFGTLGVITEATFRLHPVPADTRWVCADVPEDALARVLAAASFSPTAPATLEVAGDPHRRSLSVAALLTGTADGVESRARELGSALCAAGADPSAVTQVEDASTAPPTGYPWPLDPTGPGTSTGVQLKLTCVLSAVAELVSWCRTNGFTVRGSAGTGVLYAYAEHTDPEVLQWLRDRCVRHGGSLVVLDAGDKPGLVATGFDLWGRVPGLALMRRVKAEFDPERVLAPGRFVGGI